jgi:hypothetical protein
MYNDSIETLLLRHYGDNAPAPAGLEQRITASVRYEANKACEQDLVTRRLRENRISRRRAVQLVAFSSAGLGLLSTGIASIQTVLSSNDATTRPALS